MPKHHGVNRLGEMYQFCRAGHRARSGDRFGRMFDLSPLYMDPAVLRDLGAVGGPMDDTGAPARTTTVPVGHVFFGQFVDHDITLDVASSLTANANAEDIPNSRTPSLDLDCVYGSGPEAHPYLYHASNGAPDPFAGVKLLTGADGTAVAQDPALTADDLQRTSAGTAIIGDPRNDENRVVSQLQLGMIRFHNRVVDCLVSTPGNTLEGSELFEEARRLATWHYQWVVVNDFLVKLCGAAVVSDILGNGRRFYCPNYEAPYIPIEFSIAAYRFGHSMVPQTIQLQTAGPILSLFGNVLGRGFRSLQDARGVVDWNELVDTPAAGVVQMADRLDSKLATILLDLPFIDADNTPSLAERNLKRGQIFLLPSGENVAQAMGRDQAQIDAVTQAARALAAAVTDFPNGTPLWYYLLVEAEEIGRETTPGLYDPGEGLGPVGARIVAETIIGLIESDSRSYLATNRNWSPADGKIGVTTLGEMLTWTP